MDEVWPTVSIILPAYNAESTIERCLQSVTNLTYFGKYEVILVNNRSTDDTVNLAKKYNVRIVDAFEHQSSYYARNIGLASAHSQIAAFTDTDCIAEKNWLHYLVQPMMRNLRMAGVGGKISHLARNAIESIIGSEFGVKHNFTDLAFPFLATANAAYRMKTLEEVGFFDRTFISGGDVDLSWRIVKKGYALVYEPQAIVYHYPRKSLCSFFKQHYVYGKGRSKYFDKHRIQRDQTSELTLLLKEEIERMAVIGSFPFRLAKTFFGKNDRTHTSVMTPIFGSIMIFASSLGFIHGTKLLRQ